MAVKVKLLSQVRLFDSWKFEKVSLCVLQGPFEKVFNNLTLSAYERLHPDPTKSERPCNDKTL
jgi:hypothetical protein